MRKKKGFTLVEMLVAVAILIISFGIIGVNAGEIQTELNQFKADAIARQIFVSAQDSITKLHTSGQDVILNSQREFEYDPSTYTGSNKLKYIYSTDNDISMFCAEDAVDEGSWVIEYDAIYGQVYGVFYSSKELKPYTTTDSDEQWRHTTIQTLYDFAKENKYNISYYGGEVMDATVYTPDPNTLSTGFCYYEIYENDNDITTKEYGYYCFSNQKDMLQNRIVIGDGYGIIVNKDTDTSKITISGDQTITLSACSFEIIDDGLIMKFPSNWMTANWLANNIITKSTPTNQSKYNQNYWQKITIDYGNSKESWNYSPYYAKSAVSSIDSNNLPRTVYIRSARQLNALSWMYPSYFNKKWAWHWTEEKVVNTTFLQEVDIDYSKYKFTTYTDREFVGQMPIGTDWGRFVSIYDGGDHTIYNCKFLRRNTTGNEYNYAGLFGFVSGTIQNVHISATTNNIIENADYCGILAAYIQNSNISNCSVNNYTINYQKQSTPPSGASSPNEWKYARIGSFIGYVKSPNVNEPGSTSIYNCSATNMTIKAYDYMSTESDSRATNRCYNIGGFIGSIADREQSETYGKKVNISNCSVQVTISTKSTGNMAWFNIGAFAGAKGWPSVVNCDWSQVSGIRTNQMSSYYKSYGN